MYCGKVDIKKMIVRSNWRTECVHPGKHMKKNKNNAKLFCDYKIPNCDVLNYKKNDCVKCRLGYEKVIKVGRKWIRRKFAKKENVEKNFDNWTKNMHTRCRPCSNSQLYHTRSKECLSARKDYTREYTVKKDEHKFGPMIIPKYKESKYVVVNFD